MKKEELIIQLALYLNKELLKDNQINYQTYKLTETSLLNQLNN